MEEVVKTELGCTMVKKVGSSAGGYICGGNIFETDKGKIYVKFSNDSTAMHMFEGEMASLESILHTKAVRIPKPYKVFKLPGDGAALAMEYVDLKRGLSTFAAQLGQQMAAVHKRNKDLYTKEKKESNRLHGHSDGGDDDDDGKAQYQPQFGFHVETCCGRIPQPNEWKDSWPELYAAKIDSQVTHLEENFRNHEVRGLWDQLLRKYSTFFEDLPDIHPALLHGDLWSGNVSENDEGPVIFDPASFYGHSEFEFSISKMFGGFPRSFFDSYHEIIPRSSKFKLRERLYQLFHYINHW
ncbi:ketosamine-3-kinase [Octopus sinensis]|uniref:protein-ribulosamine 3-kinase n=1 Tax=Octopus sinensis TaxID=2607531 RepID=A0A6P7TSZ7_9MOLL|nr:ketosamine-3-kinase [Octopus sinensis]